MTYGERTWCQWLSTGEAQDNSVGKKVSNKEHNVSCFKTVESPLKKLKTEDRFKSNGVVAMKEEAFVVAKEEEAFVDPTILSLVQGLEGSYLELLLGSFT
jgi:hypothetical protein